MFKEGDKVRIIFTNKMVKEGIIVKIEERCSHPYICKIPGKEVDQTIYCRECDLEKL